jgi:membrane-associated protease RseP (regulator of RpoE activity)
MRRTWTTRSSVAVVLAIMLAAAGAAMAAQSETRIETRSDSSGQPEVHMWVNGQEVTPGRPMPVAEAEPAGEAFLGVMVSPLEGKAKEDVETHKGVIVVGVMPGSPAAVAGLQADDILVDLGGTVLESPQQLVEHVRELKPGAAVKVVFYRGGKKMEKTVTLASRPGMTMERRPMPPAPTAASEAYLGVVAAPVSKEVADIAGTAHGALVNALTDESPAAKAGLLPGDVIVSLGDQEVGSPEDLVKAVGLHKAGESVKIGYFRMGKRLSTDARLGARPAERVAPDRGRGFEIPEELSQQMPQLRKYLDELRRGIEDRVQRYRQENPNAATPEEGRPPMIEPYGVGKDIGKIMERLDRIDQRLSEIEKRLNQIEKKK